MFLKIILLLIMSEILNNFNPEPQFKNAEFVCNIFYDVEVKKQ